MLDEVVFEESWRGIKVSAYTDLYAYDPEKESLLFISIAGTDQAVKAISSAIIDGRTVSIRREGNTEIPVNGHPSSRFRVLSTKLPGGAVHQLVAQTRFLGADESEARLVIIPQDKNLSSVVYSQVLAGLASPLIPEWDAWICRRLKEMDRMQEMDGTLKVAEVSADEAIVDEIVSKGVSMKRISIDGTGGTHAGIH